MQRAIRVFVVTLTMSMPAFAELGVRHTARYPNGTVVRAMACSPDSSELAITVGRKVEFFDLETGKKKRDHASRPFSMQYTKDGKHIALLSEKETTVVDALTGTGIGVKRKRLDRGFIGLFLEDANGKVLVKSVTPGGPVARSKKINEGDEVIAISKDRHSRFSVVSGKSGPVVMGALSGPVGKYVRVKVLSRDKFDAEDAVVHEFRREPATVEGTTVTFKPFPKVTIDENIIWCMSEDYHDFRLASNGQTVAQLQTDEIANVGQHAISPDQKHFAVLASRRTGGGYAVELYNLETQLREALIPYPARSYFAIAFDSSGERLLVGADGSIEIADLGLRKFGERMALNRNVRAIACSSKGVIASITYEGKVELWDQESGDLLAEVPAGKPTHVVGDGKEILFSPDGKWLSFYIGSMLHMLDVSDFGDEPAGPEVAATSETVNAGK